MSEATLVVARPAPLMWWPKYVVTLGLAEVWRRRQTVTVTDKRVVIRRGLISKSERSLPRDKIQDVNMATQIGFGRLVISSAGGSTGVVTTPWISARAAREAVAVLNSTST